jgi:hypothetical protein
MKISRKIARMAMGHDDYHIQHDPEIPCGEAELVAKEEAEKYIDKYIDSLEMFHKDTMSFIDSLDLSKEYDRVKGAEELQALIKQGKQIQEFGLDGNIYTTD